jgi:hypothetical protein
MPTPKKILTVLLLVSAALRVCLILHGGQFYWPDETRYQHSRDAVSAIANHRFHEALFQTVWYADNIGFKVIGVIPATIEALIGRNGKIPALFFGIFSIVNIWLLWRIALRSGAGEWEALFAALLFACSNSFYYYTRHILPYDTAMTFGLTVIFIALSTRSSARRALLGASIAFLTFITYSGYWMSASFGLLILVARGRFTAQALTLRAACACAGFFLPFIVLIGSCYLCGIHVLHYFIGYSGTIIQGDFGEGWKFPFEYLWQSEHFLAVLWIFSVIYCIARARRGDTGYRKSLWLWGIVILYTGFLVCSVGLHCFVVYGRLVRQLVPFACLLSAYSLCSVFSLHTARRWKILMLSALFLQTGYNFFTPMTQEFPDEFTKKASLLMDQSGHFRLLNAEHIYPACRQYGLPPYETLLRSAHPLQFLPYQYEGYTPEQRKALRATDISMKLIRCR